MDPDALFDALHASPASPQAAPKKEGRLERPGLVAAKALLLAATTLAFVPVLLSRSAFAGTLYAILLVAVHVAGLAVVAWGVRRVSWPRVAAILALLGLLALLAPGLRDTTGPLFWVLLGGVWLVHTAGLLILHWRGTPAACPFVPTKVSP